MNGRDSAEDDRSIYLQITKLEKLIPTGSSTIFEPQGCMEKKGSSNANSVSPKRSPAVRAPVKKLTFFALELAVLEKAATRPGTLAFIWATVLLPGGFALTLDKTDFWVITFILLIEGARIFSRSHELEWQHQATWSIADAEKSLGTILMQSQHNREAAKPRNWNRRKMPAQTWTSSDAFLPPYARWIFLSRNISKLLNWLQILSAITCVILSSMGLIKHNYGKVEEGDTDTGNRRSALNVFYALALADALLFLLEKAYWEWKVIYCKLFDEVNKECKLGDLGMVSIKRFFYDAYCRCVNGSVFDGLEMDLVSFAMDLLASNSPNEQHIGDRILRQFATNEQFSDDTLQKIGITLSVIERLVEMLNWKDPQEEEIRQSAAEILSKLVGEKQNSLRVAGIPGAMESILTLLHANRNSSDAADEISDEQIIHDYENYGFSTFNNLGLRILKKLSRDHESTGKIGNTRGLLPKIIDCTHAGERLLKGENATPSQIMTVKRSLQEVKMLARTTCTAGKDPRQGISDNIFVISNIRDTLQYGEKHSILQQLSKEILSSLSLEEDAKEKIGGTGGVIKELFNIFFKHGMPENYNRLKTAAREALAMLALDC